MVTPMVTPPPRPAVRCPCPASCVFMALEASWPAPPPPPALGTVVFSLYQNTAVFATGPPNRMKWLWRSKELSESLKLRLFCVHVLSTVVWGHEGWKLRPAVERKLNGWCARCVAVITGKSVREESTWEKQSMRLPGIVRHRRCAWLGHILRADPSSLVRQAVLRFAELGLRGQVELEGTILMDTPAYTSVEMLVHLAGGSGSEEDRKENRKHWREVAQKCLCPADVERRRKGGKTGGESLKATDTLEEFLAALAAVDHSLLLYTDGGADGNGAKGEWGESGWGVSVREVGGGEDWSGTTVAELYGPVEVDSSSAYFVGAERGTNQTGELTGVIQALLWLRSNAAGRSAVIAVDSLYAANQAEGWWNAKKNKELIAVAQRLLEQVRQSGDVTFVHVRGHTGEVGNERADRLVQWGKTSGPYSRLAEVGFGEGDGRTGRVEGHLRSEKRPGEEAEYTLVLNEGEVDEFITLGDPDAEPVSDSGELEETQLTDESGSVLRWIFRDSHVASPSSSDEPGPAAEESADTDGEQGQDHSLEIELDAVVNWLENLDLGENCELSSGLEAE